MICVFQAVLAVFFHFQFGTSRVVAAREGVVARFALETFQMDFFTFDDHRKLFEPMTGIEPVTFSLPWKCSTI